jgi:cell division protein FtsI/penicillin-binding protein 2
MILLNGNWDFNPAGDYYRDFCGYFPADNPQYTIFISVGHTKNPVDTKVITAILAKIRDSIKPAFPI